MNELKKQVGQLTLENASLRTKIRMHEKHVDNPEDEADFWLI